MNKASDMEELLRFWERNKIALLCGLITGCTVITSIFMIFIIPYKDGQIGEKDASIQRLQIEHATTTRPARDPGDTKPEEPNPITDEMAEKNRGSISDDALMSFKAQIASKVNLKKEPSPLAETIGIPLNPGVFVRVIHQNDLWYRIRVDDSIEGYVPINAVIGASR